MDDQVKLEKAFEHIRCNSRVHSKFVVAAKQYEWELATRIVKDVLILLGYTLSELFDLRNAIINKFNEYF